MAEATEIDAYLQNVFVHNGWDFEKYWALQKSGAEFDRAVVINPEASKSAERIAAIHISGWERFGNSIYQLSNMAAFAKKYDIRAIYYEREHEFFEVSTMSATLGIPVHRRRAIELKDHNGLVLSSRLFFEQPYNLFPKMDRQAWIDTYIAPLIPEYLARGDPRITSDTITAHFRAGDIFSSCIHKGYGQPPLSYYKLALDQSAASVLVVVYEDKGNPTIEPFIDYAMRTKREVIVQSADLRSDLALLFGSTELISGRGSFLWAVHALSCNLKSFWYFHWAFDRSAFARPGIRVNCVTDTRGEYENEIIANNWSNTESQRRMMLEYPADALKWEIVAN